MLKLQLHINQNFFLRDPQDTDLGRKIVKESIELIDKLGFEKFTFKKLAAAINSTEASIYRYFENKHRLLNYMIAWYWNWLEYKIEFNTNNIEDPEKRMEVALRLVSEKKSDDPLFPDISEAALYRIVITESDKTYLTKQVDEDNKEGFFRGVKSLCKKLASIVHEINPDFHFAHSLCSTVLEASHQQLFFAQHLPSLTDLNYKGKLYHEELYQFLHKVIFNTIKND